MMVYEALQSTAILKLAMVELEDRRYPMIDIIHY